MAVIQTKILVPKRHSYILRRERLLNFLYEHIDRQLIMVSASAGYGKTSLLVDFASDVDFPVCWYTLDESDRDLRVFLEYFISSIEHVFPNALDEARRAIANWGSNVDPGAFAGLLVNDIVRNVPDFFVLVLDDYHLVDDLVSINLFLDAFLRHQPDNCRLIISSRTIPTLTPRGMALLVARQQVVGLGVNQLRFVPEEIQALIRQNYQEDISLEQAEGIAQESEGWITAILLTRHRMWKGLIADLVSAQEGPGSLYSYLAGEVFSMLDDERQSFLLQTAVLSFLNPAMCDAFLGRDDSEAILEELENRNMFTMRVDQGGEVWYRYHRLFREFLLARLREQSPAKELALHLRAARLFQERGDSEEAIRHYLEAGAYEQAAELIERVAHVTYDAGRVDTLLGWIEAIPEELLKEWPRLAWFKAKILWMRDQISESQEYFQFALNEFERQSDKLGVAQSLVDQSAVLRVLGRYSEALQDARKALDLMNELTIASEDVGTITRAGAYRNIGLCYYSMGYAHKGIEELRKALALFEKVQYMASMAQAHSDLGILLRSVGNFEGAQHHFQQALKIWENLGNRLGMAGALNSIGVTLYFNGDFAQALDILGLALQRAQEAGSDRLAGYIWASIGDTHLAAGHYEQALYAFRQSEPLANRAGDHYLQNYVLNALASYYLLTDDIANALQLAKGAFDRALEQNAAREAGQYELLLGIIYARSGEAHRAIQTLHHAMGLLEEGEARQDLARGWLYLAQAYYQAGRLDDFADAMAHLQELLLELGHYQFLLADAKLTAPALEYAVGQKLGGDFIQRLLTHGKAVLGQVTPAAQAPGEAPRTLPPLRVLALGETQVFVGSHLLPTKSWQSLKARQIFFYLLGHPGKSRDDIAQLFWPHSSMEKARGAFHVTLHRVRRALGIDEIIVYDGDSYRVNPDISLWYDVGEFERLLDEAEGKERQGRSDEANALRREAIDLYRGEYCADLPDMQWIDTEREALSLRYLEALLTAGEYQLFHGNDVNQALNLLERVITLDFLQERAHRLIMYGLASAGRRSEALKHFQRMEQTLWEEWGAEPEELTVQLYDHIASGQAPEGFDWNVVVRTKKG